MLGTYYGGPGGDLYSLHTVDKKIWLIQLETIISCWCRKCLRRLRYTETPFNLFLHTYVLSFSMHGISDRIG